MYRAVKSKFRASIEFSLIYCNPEQYVYSYHNNNNILVGYMQLKSIQMWHICSNPNVSVMKKTKQKTK